MSYRPPRLSPWHWRPLLVAAFFITLLGLTLTHTLPLWVIVLHGGMSVFSLINYARDKRLAARNAWRTPEVFLLFIDLLAGWPGGMLGQYIWRHKHSKLSYQLRFLLVVAINLLVLSLWILQRASIV